MTGPVLDHFAVGGATAQLSEAALTLTGDIALQLTFAFPMIGRPHFPAAGSPTVVLPPDAITVVGPAPTRAAVETARAALDGRVALVATGDPGSVLPVRLGEPVEVDGNTCLTLLGAPAERQLYDVALRAGADWQVVAPHAVYHRSSWSDFGLAHISDLHVARRIDRFRPLLRELGLTEAAERMCSMNDQFRGFVRFANALHRAGHLDLLLATGDLIDYQFEVDDAPDGLGNAGFLRDLILGRAPGPDTPEVEELLVPILMAAGNHDYRRRPYHLVFDVAVAGKELTRVRDFSNLALREREAMALTNALSFPGGTEVPDVGKQTAMNMVAIDKTLRPYQECLAPRSPHVAALGKHRVVVLDSAHDLGMPGSSAEAAWEAIKSWWGSGDENFTTLVGGSPNCEGIDDEEYATAVTALETAPDDGLVMLGLHAPLVNPWSGESPPFLRETERPQQAEQARWWLARHTDAPYDQVQRKHPEWFARGDEPEPAYLKRGNGQDLLDHGVSRGRTDALLRVLAGADTARRADLVLAGHTHRHHEISLRRLDDDSIAHFTDFYTANPSVWYPSKLVRREDVKGDRDGRLHLPTTTVYVEVDDDAVVGTPPWPMPQPAKHHWLLRVRPYADPLATTPDPRAWWEAHKPLLLQTGALGLWENDQVSFSGFRLVVVKSDIIDKVHFLARERLDAAGWNLTLEQANAPDPPRPYRLLQRSREFGSPAVDAGPYVLLPPGGGVHSLIYRDSDGLLFELWDTPAGRGAGRLADADTAGRATGAPSGFVGPDQVAVVLYRGEDAGIHSLYWHGGDRARHDALSRSCAAPDAAGDPSGYVLAGMTHVFYRTADGHIEELWWPGSEAVSHGRITGYNKEPLAAGDPFGYPVPTIAQNIVLYRGVDGHVHSLYWSSGPTGHDNLSRACGLPTAVGDPVGLYLPHLDAHNVLYRGESGRLQLIWWQGDAPATGSDWTARGGGPAAAGDPAFWYAAASDTLHVVYPDDSGHLHEIAWRPGGDVGWTDLTVAASAPPSGSSRPAGYTLPGATTRHVAYRGTDGHVHEIRWG